MKGKIYLEDGTVYEGKGFGAKGVQVGELVYNTTMVGYQSVLEDISNLGNIIVMTYPWIGNYGVMDTNSNSHSKGIIVKNINDEYSNYKSINSLNNYLIENGISGVSGVDTRSLVKKVAREGIMKCIVSTVDYDMDSETLKEYFEKENDCKKVAREKLIREKVKIEGNNTHIGILDMGDIEKIVDILKKNNHKVTMYPYNTKLEEMKTDGIEGLIISNGFDELYYEMTENIEELIGNIPLFGVELGHFIIAKAFGATVEKMKKGHFGNNHGIYDLNRKKCYMPAQNHKFVVSIEDSDNIELEVTHINLNDNSIEGLKHKNLNIRTIQFKLEEKSDLENTSYILKDFIESL